MPLIDFPTDMYHLRDGETPLYGEFPDLKKSVQWFVEKMSPGEWRSRRDAASKRFYQSLVGELSDATGKGRYFDNADAFGWYLFLGEAFTDHPWNYEVVFGSRVIPFLAAIGRNLELLVSIEGFVDRARRLLTAERSQPNSGLFEILVAAAYAREGWKVAFKPVQPGVSRTHDLDIMRGGDKYAVECKRMEGGEYVEGERERMRTLWKLPSLWLAKDEPRSTYLDVSFKVELKDVPEKYLLERVADFVDSKLPSLLWDDSLANGVVGDLDLGPIRDSLKIGYLLHPGPVFNKLLTGSYYRYDNLIAVLSLKPAVNPHFIDDLNLAVVARWASLSDAAVDKKARDIQSKLVEANAQLPRDIPGIIHIGFEALSGDEVEQRRYEKILERVETFHPEGSRLEFVYCHYFAPEASPEETWAMDETFQWMGVRPSNRPLSRGLLTPPDDGTAPRSGVHWDAGKSRPPQFAKTDYQT